MKERYFASTNRIIKQECKEGSLSLIEDIDFFRDYFKEPDLVEIMKEEYHTLIIN